MTFVGEMVEFEGVRNELEINHLPMANANQLEERLLQFATNIVLLKPDLLDCFEANHLYQQLFRSSTSAPLNYGEARGAFTTKDFANKLSISLRELRESHINLRIMKNTELCKNETIIIPLIDEANQLISILTKSIETTRKKYPNQFK